MCFVWLNTLLGLAGNRTARLKCWASFAQGAKSDLAVRLVDLMTNKEGRLSLEEAQSLAADPEVESETEVEAPTTGKKTKKKKRKRRDWDPYEKSCDDICAKHYRLDVQAVGDLARKGGIKRLSMWSEEDCSFIAGAGDE